MGRFGPGPDPVGWGSLYPEGTIVNGSARAAVRAPR